MVRFALRDEIAKLRHDLSRYRFLLSSVNDPGAISVIKELITEAEARLTELSSPDGGKKGHAR